MYWTCKPSLCSTCKSSSQIGEMLQVLVWRPACSDKALSFDDLKARHTTAVTIQAVLLIALVSPAADSLHLAAVLCLPADMGCVLRTYSGPSLFVKMFPGHIRSLVVA